MTEAYISIHAIYATIINGQASTTILVDSIEYVHSTDPVQVILKGHIPLQTDKTVLAFTNGNHLRVDESTRGDNIIMED